MIKIEIAGLKIALENKYPYIENYVQGYQTDGEVDFSVHATDETVEAERHSADGRTFPSDYCESICLYREIAERLPLYDAFVFHGCVLACNGGAYLLTAQSGVGKTTHAGNWLRAFKDRVHILNGDKPVIRIIDGTPIACGTPWRGKEGYGINESLPLKSIVFLERGNTNETFEISKSDALTKFMKQIYLPRKDKVQLLSTMRLADKVLSSVELVGFRCTKEIESAGVLYERIIKN